jgi:hypothetical protein
MTQVLTDSPALPGAHDTSPRVAALKRDDRVHMWANLRAAVIGPSASWHAFADRLIA